MCRHLFGLRPTETLSTGKPGEARRTQPFGLFFWYEDVVPQKSLAGRPLTARYGQNPASKSLWPPGAVRSRPWNDDTCRQGNLERPTFPVNRGEDIRLLRAWRVVVTGWASGSSDDPSQYCVLYLLLPAPNVALQIPRSLATGEVCPNPSNKPVRSIGYYKQSCKGE